MTIIDANVLLYAYNADAPQQHAAEQWLMNLLAGAETIAIPWVTVWAFLRICTNSRLWSYPLDAKQVFRTVSEWLSQPAVVVLQPGPRHAELLERLVVEHSVAGALVKMPSFAMKQGCPAQDESCLR